MFDDEIAASVGYLGSAEALACLEASSYWPKWDSPWWHMLMLHEMGETRRIPERTMRAFVDAMKATPFTIFMERPGEMPKGADPYFTACHCQLGNVYRVLDGFGVDVDAELPWVGPWFVANQMADGGMNCDESAYAVTDECPSSMVGTIAAFEAMALKSHRALTNDERRFLDRAAGFIIGRQVMMGFNINAQRSGAGRRAELVTALLSAVLSLQCPLCADRTDDLGRANGPDCAQRGACAGRCASRSDVSGWGGSRPAAVVGRAWDDRAVGRWVGSSAAGGA